MAKKSGLYTRTGDAGTTSLVGGTRVPKTDARLEAYGTVDELNSSLGMLASFLSGSDDYEFLLGIQNNLFVLSAYLATDQSKAQVADHMRITDGMVAELEGEIDRIDALVPAKHYFVLPGGCRPAAWCQVCRTVCRRAERRILALLPELEIDAALLRYINRLSDYLYVLARKINSDQGTDEILWKANKK